MILIIDRDKLDKSGSTGNGFRMFDKGRRAFDVMSIKISIAVALIFTGHLTGCASYPPMEINAQLPSDYTYVIGPGDSVEMFVWGNPEVSRTVPVRPDGKMTAPLVEELKASGKTPYQLARDIEKELARYIRNPLVTVIVSGFNGPYSQQIKIIGAFGGGGGGGGFGGGGGGFGGGGGGRGGFGGGGNIYQARAFPYTEDMTLLDLTVSVGNLGAGYGDGNRASIVRVINGERRQFGVRLDDLVEDGDMSANVELLPGDILFIPEAYF